MKKIKYAIAILCALAVAFVIEFSLFTCGSVYTPVGEYASAVNGEAFDFEAIGYSQNGSVYTPTGRDPHLRLSGIGRSVKYVLLKFNPSSNPVTTASIYYAKADENFSDKNAVHDIDVPYAANQVLVELPENVYDCIKIDVNGQFDLNDVLLLSEYADESFSLLARPMSAIRIICVFAVLSALLFFLTKCLAEANERRASRSLTDGAVSFKNALLARPLTLLSILMLGTACAVFFQFIFEKQLFIYADSGCDTRDVYYPFFMSLQRKLESGDFSMWNLNYGIGTNIITRQADVGSIFTWLTVSFGADAIKYLLTFIHVLKIVLSGYVCYFFLGQFDFSSAVKVTVSYIFAFNGFTMLWGQHYFFGTASLCVILVFFGVEKALRTRRGYLWLAATTCVVALNSYYFAYMTLLAAGVYALFRILAIFTAKDVKQAAKKLGVLLGGVCLGVGMAAALFVPAAIMLMSTSSRVGGASLTDTLLSYLKAPILDVPTLKNIVLRFFSNNLNGTNDYNGILNYYEAPQLFFSSFALFFVFLFVSDIILDRSEKIKAKILKGLATLTVLFLLVHPFLSVILNGFVAPFFRYTFLVMPALALCFAYAMSKLIYGRLRYPVLQTVCSMALSVALLLLASGDVLAHESEEPTGWLVCILAILISALALMLMLQIKKAPRILKLVCTAGIVLAIAVNVASDSYVATNRRTFLSEVSPTVYSSVENTLDGQALEFIKQRDGSFYRVDKNYRSFALLNDSLLEGYYGVSTYNSVVNKHLTEFTVSVCPEMRPYDKDGYYDFHGIYRDADVAALFGVKYIFSHSPIVEMPEYTLLATFDTLHVYENTKATGVARFYTGTVSQTEFDAMSVSERKEALTNAILLDGVNESTSPSGASAKTVFNAPTSSSNIEGTVNASGDGWLMLSIPYENGWTAYVDGKEVDIVRADVAFCAIQISEGEHSVSFRYQTPLIIPGMIISAICVTAFVALCVFEYRYNKKYSSEDLKNNDSF